MIILFIYWHTVVGCKSNNSFNDFRSVVKVSQYSHNLPLSPNDPFWSSQFGPETVSIELGPQLITNPQWPNPSTKKVGVQAARTQSEIAVLLQWPDDSQESHFSNSGLYSDKAAVMFPLDPSKEIPLITMGAEGMFVNIWEWKAVLQQFGGRSPVEDLNAEGFSTLTFQTHQDVKGKGVWTNKVWRVVFKRSLFSSDSNDTQFKDSTPMAIAIWNGANRETNGQKGLSSWLLLKFV